MTAVVSERDYKPIPSSLLSSAFLCSFIADSFNLSISSQQLAADPLNDDDTELYNAKCSNDKSHGRIAALYDLTTKIVL